MKFGIYIKHADGSKPSLFAIVCEENVTKYRNLARKEISRREEFPSDWVSVKKWELPWHFSSAGSLSS